MDILSKGAKVFLMTIMASIMSFFVVIAFNALGVGMFTEQIGYNAKIYQNADTESETSSTSKRDESKLIDEYKFYFKDGEDLKKAEYEAEGYEIVEQAILSDVQKGPDMVLGILSQICTLLILVFFLYNELWKIGNKDFESFRLYGKKVSKYQGLYIGLVAVAPMFFFLTFCVVTQKGIMADLPIAINTFLNCYAFEILLAATGGVIKWAEVKLLSVIAFYAVLLIIPIICCISYVIGYKDILLFEKFVYKNNKIKKRG